ncbi:protein-tyrosine-phosphatase [Polymorphobacter glacialis]|uniref:Protein-tyrosine-phosphatase n=1 Tax=Sandarakinorhabdus glacialis TaxID=1614636 RepID=A0A917E383_9SPHN|nr:tyrosine-protein phosphatase [Polymorphobacter glacialis]GGE00671.1 protein-tyrosine-phosphatase [Polymorphobacter glacialis]
MDNRVFALTGVHNFRDLGGYSAGRSKLRAGRLFRSGHHFGATPEDLTAIEALGLRAVIDLRSIPERQAFPCRRAAGFSAEVLHLDDFPPRVRAETAPHIEAALRAGGAPEAHEMMRASYDGMPFRPELQFMLRRYLVRLAADDTPSLIHCFAGKDRTGLLVAVLHRALGVHADDIMADYLLTNTAGDPEARIADGAQFVRQMHGGAVHDDAIRVIMSVDADYLTAAMRAIDELPGGFDGYLQTQIGITRDQRAGLDERLLEA